MRRFLRRLWQALSWQKWYCAGCVRCHVNDTPVAVEFQSPTLELEMGGQVVEVCGRRFRYCKRTAPDTMTMDLHGYGPVTCERVK